MKQLPLVFCLFLLSLARIAHAQTAPILFYTDLPGGMCTGGQDNRGHIVTVRGKNFGNAPDASHYVAVGGANAATYLLWQDDKIAFQLGCSLGDGDYSITV